MAMGSRQWAMGDWGSGWGLGWCPPLTGRAKAVFAPLELLTNLLHPFGLKEGTRLILGIMLHIGLAVEWLSVRSVPLQVA